MKCIDCCSHLDTRDVTGQSERVAAHQKRRTPNIEADPLTAVDTIGEMLSANRARSRKRQRTECDSMQCMDCCIHLDTRDVTGQSKRVAAHQMRRNPNIEADPLTAVDTIGEMSSSIRARSRKTRTTVCDSMQCMDCCSHLDTRDVTDPSKRVAAHQKRRTPNIEADPLTAVDTIGEMSSASEIDHDRRARY